MRALLRSRPLWLTCLFHPQARRTLLTQARLKGPLDPPLLEETVGDNFSRIVSSYGDRNAVISRHQNGRLTYHQLDLDSNVLARGLQSLGVKKGDRVCVSLGNNLEFATITYALFKLGAILVPLNPAFTATQIISALNHLSASHLVIGTETNLPYKPPQAERVHPRGHRARPEEDRLWLLMRLPPSRISSWWTTPQVEQTRSPFRATDTVAVDIARRRLGVLRIPASPLSNTERWSTFSSRLAQLLCPKRLVCLTDRSSTTAIKLGIECC